MTTGGKIALISVSLIGIGAAVYFIFFRKKPQDKVVGPVVPENNTIIEKRNTVIIEKKQNPKRYTTESSPLKKYDYGPNVKCLQKLLNWRGYKDDAGKVLVVDGKWGNSTQQALDNSKGDLSWGNIDNGLGLSNLRSRVAWTPSHFNITNNTLEYLKDTPECKNASCCQGVEQKKIDEEPEEVVDIPLYNPEANLSTYYANQPIVAVQDNTAMGIGYGFFSGNMFMDEKSMI